VVPFRVRRLHADWRHLRTAAFYQLLTFAVVALTGLSELYFGAEYFGAPHQYLLAFLWGFGGKLGLDVVRTAIVTQELPWPKRAPAPTAPPAGTGAVG
jgi:hypothetical protein